MKLQQQHRQPGLWVGAFFIVFGSILLLDRLDFIEARTIFRFWPAVLVVLGFTKLVSSHDTGNRLFGGMLTAIGAVLLSNAIGLTDIRFRDLWPLAIIAAGVGLLIEALKGPRSELPSADTEHVMQEFAIFGGSNHRYRTQRFQGGAATAIFGGLEPDLRQAEIDGDVAEINTTAIFGGIVLKVPEHWTVVLRGVPIFGGFEDKTYHPRPGDATRTKTLIVRGAAIFGGIEVKN
ncbi:MAG: DUF5668 domain-containing protein [Bryobacteraceae bacterium]|nr:DUF5668 domain-containing protein [Bryobacteraceae bacterium]